MKTERFIGNAKGIGVYRDGKPVEVKLLKRKIAPKAAVPEKKTKK